MRRRRNTIPLIMADLESRTNELLIEFNYIASKSKNYTKEKDVESAYKKLHKLTLELLPVAHQIQTQQPKIYALMDMLVEWKKSQDKKENEDGNTGTDITA